MHLESFVALGTLLLAVAAFFLPYRQGVKKAKAEAIRQAEEDRKQALEDLTAPIRNKLKEMTEERDMYRNIVLTNAYKDGIPEGAQVIVVPKPQVHPRPSPLQIEGN